MSQAASNRYRLCRWLASPLLLIAFLGQETSFFQEERDGAHEERHLVRET
jgi:hypothetical protein